MSSTTWSHPVYTWFAVWSFGTPFLKVRLDNLPSLRVGSDRHTWAMSCGLVYHQHGTAVVHLHPPETPIPTQLIPFSLAFACLRSVSAHHSFPASIMISPLVNLGRISSKTPSAGLPWGKESTSIRGFFPSIISGVKVQWLMVNHVRTSWESFNQLVQA